MSSRHEYGKFPASDHREHQLLSIPLALRPSQHFFVSANCFGKRLPFIAKAALLRRSSESLVGDVFPESQLQCAQARGTSSCIKRIFAISFPFQSANHELAQLGTLASIVSPCRHSGEVLFMLSLRWLALQAAGMIISKIAVLISVASNRLVQPSAAKLVAMKLLVIELSLLGPNTALNSRN
jgi:hypothetical protein